MELGQTGSCLNFQRLYVSPSVRQMREPDVEIIMHIKCIMKFIHYLVKLNSFVRICFFLIHEITRTMQATAISSCEWRRIKQKYIDFLRSMTTALFAQVFSISSVYLSNDYGHTPLPIVIIFGVNGYVRVLVLFCKNFFSVLSSFFAVTVKSRIDPLISYI